MKDPAPAMQSFVKNYRKRFRIEPNFPALHAYDATRMVLAALQKTTDPVEVREQLLQLGQFKGIQSNLAMDQYGDLKQPQLHLARIADGKFIDID
jgi:branched-chain amino acid transport system substrate-binding protein